MKDKKRKVALLILSRYLWPIDNGRKMNLNYYCKGLAEDFGYNVYLYCFLEPQQQFDEKDTPDYIVKVYQAKKISTLTKLKNLVIKSIGKQWPLQCSLYYSKENCNEIDRLCNEIRPNIVITEMIRTCPYYEVFCDLADVKIANIDDLLSKRYSMQNKLVNQKGNILGSYGADKTKAIHKIIHLFSRIILHAEARRCLKWEKEYYGLFDYVYMTSDLETKKFNQMMNGEKAINLSVGVDYQWYSQVIAEKAQENRLSFLGNFYYGPNVDSLKIIIEDILPKLRHDYKLDLIGKFSKELAQKYQDNKNIHFLGRVDDIRKYIQRSKIFVSPIAHGGGIKTKILDAMAMGMPVVTNSLGAEGLKANNGVHFLVSDDVEKLSSYIDDLLDDPERMKELGENAQMFVFENHRWEVIYKAFEQAGL